MSLRTLAIVALVIGVIVIGALFFPTKMHHIQLPAEPVVHLDGFAITNTMIAGWLASLALLALFYFGSSNAQMVPSGLQNFIEFVSEFVLGLCESVAGVQRGRQFFPLVATIFFFVLTANWMGLLPGYGTIGVWETPHTTEAGQVETTVATKQGLEKEKTAESKEKDAAAKPAGAAEEHHEDEPILVPLLRSAATDLNTTLAIALVSVITVQFFGLRTLGGEYVQRFFNFREGPIGVFVGILEIIAELGRVISFSFRLFGNIFAGEVVLAVITFLLPWVVAIPFLGLELFVGFIQALVFALLTLVFMSLATTSHAQHAPDHGGHQPAHREHSPAHH